MWNTLDEDQMSSHLGSELNFPQNCHCSISYPNPFWSWSESRYEASWELWWNWTSIKTGTVPSRIQTHSAQTARNQGKFRASWSRSNLTETPLRQPVTKEIQGKLKELDRDSAQTARNHGKFRTSWRNLTETPLRQPGTKGNSGQVEGISHLGISHQTLFYT